MAITNTVGGYMKPAPGVTSASQFMHAGETSVHTGHSGSQTGNGHDIGQHKTFAQTSPGVHYNKPQHDSQFLGTFEHKAETSIHKGSTPGSRTTQPQSDMPVAGNWPA